MVDSLTICIKYFVLPLTEQIEETASQSDQQKTLTLATGGRCKNNVIERQADKQLPPIGRQTKIA